MASTTYTAVGGDNLWDIAREHGLTLPELIAANPQFAANPDKLAVGDAIVIPGKTGAPPPVPRQRPIMPAAAPPPMPRPRPDPLSLATLPPPPLPGQIAAQGRAIGPGGVSGAANLYSPATLAPAGAIVPPPPVPGSANLIGLPMPGGAVNAGTNGAAGAASLAGMAPGGNVTAGSGATGAASLDPTERNAARADALAFLTNQLGAMNPANVIPQPSAAMVQLEAMREDEPSAWFGMGGSGGADAGEQISVQHGINGDGLYPAPGPAPTLETRGYKRSPYDIPVRGEVTLVNPQSPFRNHLLTGEQSRNIEDRRAEVWDTNDLGKVARTDWTYPTPWTLTDEPSAWWGGNDFESLSAPKRNETNIYDSAVKNIGGKILAEKLGEAVQSLPSIDAEELQNSGAAGMQGLQDQLGGLIGDGLSGLAGLLPSGGSAPPMQTAGLAGGTSPVPGSATLSPGTVVPPASGLTSRSVQTVPIDPMTGMPYAAAPPPEQVFQPGMLGKDRSPIYDPSRGSALTGIVRGTELPGPKIEPFNLEGLLRGIDASNGQSGENATQEGINWGGIADSLGIGGMFKNTPQPQPQVVQPETQIATGDYGYNAVTGAYEKKVPGQAYTAGGPTGTVVADKEVAQLPSSAPTTFEPDVQVASAGLPYSGTGSGGSLYSPPPISPTETAFSEPVQTASIVPPVPFPYPLKTPVPPAAAKDYIDIVVQTPETPSATPEYTPPAVASETSVIPPEVAGNSPMPSSYMPPFVPKQPMVTLASGRTVPMGTTGTAQNGRYSYREMDGGVWNDTLGRWSAPPPAGIPAVPPPQTNPANIIPGKPSFLESAFNATPIGHVAQMLQGKQPTGGLLSLFNGQKAPTGSGSKPSGGVNPTDLQNMLNSIYG